MESGLDGRATFQSNELQGQNFCVFELAAPDSHKLHVSKDTPANGIHNRGGQNEGEKEGESGKRGGNLLIIPFP